MDECEPLMAGTHSGAGNADAMFAGPVTAPGVTNAVCAGTEISCSSEFCTVGVLAAVKREACRGSRVVTGQSGAVRSGNSTRPGITVTGRDGVENHHPTDGESTNRVCASV